MESLGELLKGREMGVVGNERIKVDIVGVLNHLIGEFFTTKSISIDRFGVLTVTASSSEIRATAHRKKEIILSELVEKGINGIKEIKIF